MRFIEFVKNLFRKNLYNETWTCNACFKENFNQKPLCNECESKLEYIGTNSCSHCGRALKVSQNYCSTCKNRLLSTVMGKSVFVYNNTIATLIQRFKYNGAKYLKDYFAKEMSNVYFMNYYATDFLVFVPMSKKAEKKRGYNQSKLLASSLSKIVGVSVLDVITKVKNTKRQAKLNKLDRMKNLEGAFKITDKKLVKGKKFTVIDDVTTTGSTIEVIAKLLLKSGAKEVKFLTLASVPPTSGY